MKIIFLMDSRKTLVVTETFQQILFDIYNTQQKASLLYDDQGVTRAEGLITDYKKDGNESYIVLDNGQKLLINKIIAVNGTFLSDYSEC